MKDKMIQIFKTTQLFEANVVEALLKENDIPTFVINKQDSSYGVLLPGSIELYIPAAHEQKAKDLLKVQLS